MTAVFALGSNGSGQLGIGHDDDVSVPTPAIFPSTGVAIVPIALAAGGNHTLLLASSGRVYWSGDASSGACGTSALPIRPARPTQPPQPQPQPQPGDHMFHALDVANTEAAPDTTCLVAATWEASVMVQRDDSDKATRVYTFGTGNKGELGQGPLLVRSATPTPIRNFPPLNTEVVSLSACMSHVVAVLSDGSAWGWGAGRKGQLGAPAEAVIHTPRRISAPFGVARAVCGREFTVLFAAPELGEWLLIGPDKWGIADAAPPQIRGWVDVRSSWGSMYVLSTDGTLRGWGRNDHGELPPQGLPPVRHFAAGSEHVVALSETGEVLTWGWGEHGNCGAMAEGGDIKGRWNIIASHKNTRSEKRITGIGAGCATSWLYIN